MEPATSANRTVTSLRSSPPVAKSGFPVRTGAAGLAVLRATRSPQCEQNTLVGASVAPQRSHVAINGAPQDGQKRAPTSCPAPQRGQVPMGRNCRRSVGGAGPRQLISLPAAGRALGHTAPMSWAYLGARYGPPFIRRALDSGRPLAFAAVALLSLLQAVFWGAIFAYSLIDGEFTGIAVITGPVVIGSVMFAGEAVLRWRWLRRRDGRATVSMAPSGIPATVYRRSRAALFTPLAVAIMVSGYGIAIAAVAAAHGIMWLAATIGLVAAYGLSMLLPFVLGRVAAGGLYLTPDGVEDHPDRCQRPRPTRTGGTANAVSPDQRRRRGGRTGGLRRNATALVAIPRHRPVSGVGVTSGRLRRLANNRGCHAPRLSVRAHAIT